LQPLISPPAKAQISLATENEFYEKDIILMKTKLFVLHLSIDRRTEWDCWRGPLGAAGGEFINICLDEAILLVKIGFWTKMG
jgi:hypothetical protein